MGRYIGGSAGFEYKYLFAAQPDNLRELAARSGAGQGGLLPRWLVHHAGDRKPLRLDILPFARALAKGGARGEVTAFAKLRRYVSTLEFVQYAMAENLVEVLVWLDAASPGAVQRAELVGFGGYRLERRDHDALFAWLLPHLPPRTTLDDVRSLPLELDHAAWQPYFTAVQAAEDGLVWLGLRVLHHALAHDLDLVRIWDREPVALANLFWRELIDDWAPERLRSGQDRDARLARALCDRLRGATARARAAFAALADDPRAARYVLDLAAPPAAPKATSPTAEALDRRAWESPVEQLVFLDDERVITCERPDDDDEAATTVAVRAAPGGQQLATWRKGPPGNGGVCLAAGGGRVMIEPFRPPGHGALDAKHPRRKANVEVLDGEGRVESTLSQSFDLSPLALAANGRWAAVVEGSGGSLQVFDTSSGRRAWQADLATRWACFSPDSASLAAVGVGDDADVLSGFDTATGAVRWTLSFDQSAGLHCAFTADGRLLVVNVKASHRQYEAWLLNHDGARLGSLWVPVEATGVVLHGDTAVIHGSSGVALLDVARWSLRSVEKLPADLLALAPSGERAIVGRRRSQGHGFDVRTWDVRPWWPDAAPARKPAAPPKRRRKGAA